MESVTLSGSSGNLEFYMYWHIPVEITRKMAHIGVCALFGLVAYINLNFIWQFCLISMVWVGMNLLHKLKYLNWVINVKRKGVGHQAIFFGLGCILVLNYFHPNLRAYYYSIFVLGIADSLAVYGSKIEGLFHKTNGKTITGTFIFLLTSLFISYLFGVGVNSPALFVSLLIFGGILEHHSTYGLDNISIPVFSYLVACLCKP